jgi:hypothetical protein
VINQGQIYHKKKFGVICLSGSHFFKSFMAAKLVKIIQTQGGLKILVLSPTGLQILWDKGDYLPFIFSLPILF